MYSFSYNYFMKSVVIEQHEWGGHGTTHFIPGRKAGIPNRVSCSSWRGTFPALSEAPFLSLCFVFRRCFLEGSNSYSTPDSVISFSSPSAQNLICHMQGPYSSKVWLQKLITIDLCLCPILRPCAWQQETPGPASQTSKWTLKFQLLYNITESIQLQLLDHKCSQVTLTQYHTTPKIYSASLLGWYQLNCQASQNTDDTIDQFCSEWCYPLLTWILPRMDKGD